MKFGQVIDITREIFFSKNHAENKAGRLVPDLFFLVLSMRNYRIIKVVQAAHYQGDVRYGTSSGI